LYWTHRVSNHSKLIEGTQRRDLARLNAEVGAADAVANTLRALVAEQHDEIERLRAAGDVLAEVADEWPELVEAWQRARK
jgi:hypothetical protein